MKGARILKPISAALMAATLLACTASRPRARERSSSAVGQQLVLTAPNLDGREVDVGAAAGTVRVVDFWATWCEPCKEAMPELDRIARELGPRGLQVYGLSVDEDVGEIKRFLQGRPVHFPILWDEGAARLSRLDVSFMPVTLLVDRRGTIRYVHQGWDSARARQQRRELETLLGEP